ncbi:septum formation protein Maf [Tumebacillus algifaecis]|uniref:dTTP/UTP pyrophosphatase n=1 Tax=Tumebacillus algifaecis TaxID=1214604 RepID=A0A223D084_9BACL|nr:Maf family protein [Tumebacillus algifaecis]ASS74941.1 septum formation protein Maf [Tumebacillus algifaecis]
MQEKLLVLASGSPRRKELLAGLGLSFEVKVSEVDETFELGLDPTEIVQELAYKKAKAVANSLSHGLVLGADTIVVSEGVILGKPVDVEDAKRMLSKLSGRAHMVYTGIALVEAGGGMEIRDVSATKVVMKELSPELISGYVATGDPMDKAGSYGIQGAASAFIPEIQGDYFNVVGLPVSLVADHLARFGFELFTAKKGG